MTTDTRPPRRSHPEFLTIIGCILMVAAAIGLGLSIWSQAATWWRMRAFAPVEAQLLEAKLHPSKSRRGGWPYSLTARYEYQYKGVHFTNTELGPALSSFLSMGDQLMYRRLRGARGGVFLVWVDPHNPGVVVLDRDFGWFSAAVMFVLSMLAMWPVHRILDAPHPLSSARHVRADPGKWRVGTAIALQWNLLTIPIASVALVVTAHFFIFVLASFMLVLLGLGGARAACETWRNERCLGALTLENPGNGGTPSTLRVRFRKPFGTGCDPVGFLPEIWCELRQVEYYRVTEQRSWKLVWTSPPQRREVARGAASVDFIFSPPPWSPTESWEPGYWELVLCALDVEITFKLPP